MLRQHPLREVESLLAAGATVHEHQPSENGGFLVTERGAESLSPRVSRLEPIPA